MREPAIEAAESFASDPFRLREARRWIGRLMLEAGLSSGDTHDLAVAFSEVAANVHRHAYRGRRNGRVDVRLKIEGEQVVLAIDHDGERFDPSRYRMPDLRRPAEGGYGMYLIASLVDDVSFEGTATGERIVLVKRCQLSGAHV